MSETNLPAPVPQQEPDPHEKLANMAQSLLGWSQVAQFTMNELIVALIRSQANIGFNKFHTPNGRNCILIIGVGDEVVGLLTDVAYTITKGSSTDEDQDQGPQGPHAAD